MRVGREHSLSGNARYVLRPAGLHAFEFEGDVPGGVAFVPGTDGRMACLFTGLYAARRVNPVPR
ncbi:MAG: hypothetical protein M3Q55_01700 [Acidobacteriota bacterium]|nr:hypothetical protein [Acidobacteriota bacterium]